MASATPAMISEGDVQSGLQSGSIAATGEQEDPNDIFDLLMVLGQGSYGTVYKACIRATGEIVAIKVIPVAPHGEQSAIQKEINMLRECQHPNIVRYMGSWRSADALWIVMEYCGGGSVTDLITAAGGHLEEELIAYICSEMLAGLAYLHSIGKVHRDIKCGNVLLSETGQVKLADFGVAAQLTNTMSKRKTYIGTPHWMAPEVIAESRYDGKVDVWAVGVSAIEMAEGSPPRWRVHPMRVIFLIGREPPPALAERDRWSLTLHDFIAQCLQKEPKVRPNAKYLMQHKFVTQVPPAVPSALQPLIQHSQDLITAAALADQNGTLGGSLSRQDAAAATGQFSWRVPPGGTTGTVLAGAGPGGTSNARGPWAKTGMARARLEGLSFGQPTGTVRHEPAQEGMQGWSGTVLVDGSPAGSNAGSVSGRSGTVVQHGSSGTVVVGGSIGGASSVADSARHGGTIVEQRASHDGADYMAALRAVSSQTQGYMAAVNAAAKEAETDHRANGAASAPHLASVAPSPAPFVPPAAAAGGPKGDKERMLDRLRGVYSSGAVIPLPFLSASLAAPAALMADVRESYCEVTPETYPLSVGLKAPLHKDAWLHALRALAASGAAGQAAGPGAGPKAQTEALPAAALQQVQSSGTLQNLARSLAYAQRTLAEQPLSPRSRQRAQGNVDNLSDTLRTILCL